MAAEESRVKRLAATAAVVIIILLVFAGSLQSIARYGPPKAGSLSGVIKVGCITYTADSPLGPASIEVKRGLELWVKDANRTGIDVAGKKYGVKLVCIDDVNPTTAEIRNAVLNLITSQQVDVIIAPPGSSYSRIVMEQAENRMIPTILTYADDDALYTRGWNYSVMLMTPQFRQITSVFNALDYYNVSYKNIAVLYEAVPTGELRNVSTRLTSYASQHQLEIVYKSAFTPDNVSDLVREMVAQKANPNIIFVAAWSSDAIKAVIEAIDANRQQMTTLKHIVLMVPSASLKQVAPQIGQKLHGALRLSMWEPIAPISPFMAANLGLEWYGYTTGESFVIAYKQAYGTNPTDLAAIGYAAGLLVQYAYEESGSLDHAQVMKALRNAYIMTFYGAIGFQGSEHFAGGSTGLQEAHKALVVELVRTAESHKHIIIWPPEFATEPYVAP